MKFGAAPRAALKTRRSAPKLPRLSEISERSVRPDDVESVGTMSDSVAQDLQDMRAELPVEIANAVSSFAASVTDIEAQVKRLQKAPWAELCRGLSHLESARLHLMVAYTVNTLFYSTQLHA